MTELDKAETWRLTHRERADVADMLEALGPEQWTTRSGCGDWSVHTVAGHIVAGAEQTTANFLTHLASSGFRFNTMIDRDARRAADASRRELVRRLRNTTSTTNGPPAPAITMLGEAVVHGEDIRRPLGIPASTPPEALVACLAMYAGSSFPIGTKKRIGGLRLVATDVDWSTGSGPEVTGPAMALLVAMTGRQGSIDELSGAGRPILTKRLPTRERTPG